MRFVVHDTALNGDDTLLVLIDRIIDRIADEVHRVEIPAADQLQDSAWYQQARPTRRKLLMSAVASPPHKKIDERGPHVKMIVVEDAESARLADRLAHTAFVVLVEDREADGLLLDILVEKLGWPSLRMLWERGREVTPRAVEIDSAGGDSAIPDRVQRAVGDATQENRPVRLFVICDSDAKWPGDSDPQLERKLNKMRKACEDHDVPYHVWEKRCAENYIPDEVIKEVRDDPRNSNRVDRFSALLRRSALQRDHFPVKDGLSEKERTDAIREGLYDGSEKSDLLLLEERLFAKRPRPLKRLYEERRDLFTESGLRKRDGINEIDKLLENLAKEL